MATTNFTAFNSSVSVANVEVCLQTQLEEAFLDLKGNAYCHWFFDGDLCWPTTPANTTVRLTCPNARPDYYAELTCGPNGTWVPDGFYFLMCQWCIALGECEPHGNVTAVDNNDEIAYWHTTTFYINAVSSLIYIIGNSIGIILLSVALFIFCYLKCLASTRISIHKNLVVSFIVKSVIQILHLHFGVYVWSNPLENSMNKETIYLFRPEYCRPVLSFYYYSLFANLSWMFLEGLFLLSRITVSVFSKEPNFIVFYIIGWICPIPFVAVWATVLHFEDANPCWDTEGNWKYFWILYAPMCAFLFANFIFLTMIVFILVTKLRASHEEETAQIRKAAKATAVLLPLLGVTNILFMFENSGDRLKMKGAIYGIIQALLNSTQGILVAILYCFLNKEVRSTIRRKFSRFRREKNRRDRRRFSKTSTYLMTSSTEVNTGRNGVDSSHASNRTSVDCGQPLRVSNDFKFAHNRA
ncbi:corticotropin-releasing factor receptor 2-like [Saccoglossus kowalevskii]